MEYTNLGTTGLKVSVMGLGCGGHSRLGISTGHTEAEAIGIVNRAIELGVNFIDTAESYHTEVIVGKAIKNVSRETLIISTKVSPHVSDRLRTRLEVTEALEGNLKRLNIGFIDIMHLHGVSLEDYAYVYNEQLPALLKLRDQGKLRFVGITEQFINDPQHNMLMRALQDDCWQVVMIGFNLLNQSARERLFSITHSEGIGVLGMFAVRRALSRPEVLRQIITELRTKGLLDETGSFDFNIERDLLTLSSGELTELSYRFCRHEPGIDVVLTGTGNVEHLKQNVASINRGALPSKMRSALN